MTSSSRPARILALVAASAVLCGTAACTGSSGPGATGTPTPTSGAATTTGSPKPPAAPAVDPLTGGRPSRNGVVAVKIDDTSNGRPQRNIDKADIVYIEEVEGGLTRLLGVYNSSLPSVEAVRSVRAADPELASQYGRIAFVTSGGARVPLRVLDRSYLKTSINDRGGPGLSRDPNRPVPYNVVANLAQVAKALKPPKAKDVGFRWAVRTNQLKGARSGTRVSTVVGGTPVEFRYSAKTHRYTRYINGQAQRAADGNLITTPNVLVQFCRVTVFTADRDVLGNPNKFTHTTGRGKVVLFRDGKRLVGTWARGKLTSGTAFKTAAGQNMLLRPGGAWVVLTRTGARLA